MKSLLPTLAAVLAAPGLCLADTDATSASSPELVVTATRLPSELADVPDAIVIDRSEIDRRQAVFAADILDLVPGIALSRTGAFGGVTSVRLRGAASDKTLVLIDGVPQNDPSNPNGLYDFANLDLADVERVEILEGPQSSLWGSDAIGGVISFTTRELDGWRFAGEGGTLTTFDGSGAIGKRTDRWAAGFSISGDRSDGVAKADGIGPRNPYWEWTAGGYGRVTPASWLTLDGHVRYQQSYASIDGYDATTFAFGFTPQFMTARGWTGDIRAVANAPWDFTDTLTVGLFDLDRGDTYIGHPELSSRFAANSQSYRFTAEKGAATDPFGVVFGAERLDTAGSLSTGDTESLGTTSGFVEARVRLVAPLTLTGAARYDAPDSFAGAATGHVSAVLKLGGGFSLEGAWGQGFKTPTVSELACDFCFPGGPSVGLKPEHADGWDGAIAWTSGDGGVSAKLTGYHLAVRDQIEFAASFPFRYMNIDATRTDGLELQASARLSRNLTLDGEYAYTDAVDLASHTEMLRTPRNSGSVTLAWASGRWRAELTARSEGPDADINPSTFVPETRPGFALVGLSGAYDLTPHVQLTARIEDFGNTHYEEVLGYGEPRRMIFFGIRAKG